MFLRHLTLYHQWTAGQQLCDPVEYMSHSNILLHADIWKHNMHSSIQDLEVLKTSHH